MKMTHSWSDRNRTLSTNTISYVKR